MADGRRDGCVRDGGAGCERRAGMAGEPRGSDRVYEGGVVGGRSSSACRPLVRDEDAVVRLAPAYEHEKAVIISTEPHRGAGQVIRQAALLQDSRAEWKVCGCSRDAGVVGSELVFSARYLDGVDGATDVRTAGGGI